MKNRSIDDVEIISIPKIIDEEGRGKLSVIEKSIVPFEIKRVYYLYDVPSDAFRGGHAHKNLTFYQLSHLTVLQNFHFLVIHYLDRYMK